jgi:hypothetical protein
MAYEPTVWKNRVVERPLTFNMINNPDGTVTLVPAPGVIVESGTPVNAVNLNKLEQGLKTHEADIATQERHGLRLNSDGYLEFYDGLMWKRSNTIYSIFYYDGVEKIEFVEGYSVGNGSVSKESDYLYIRTFNNPNQVAERTYVTNNLIDLSKIKVIYIEWENQQTEGTAFLNISTEKMGGRTVYDAQLAIGVGDHPLYKQISVLDVSNLNGEYYIRIHARDGFSTKASDNTLKIYKLWGEG